MTDVENLEDLPPVAGASIVYLGPVAPHWEIRAQFGESEIIDGFRARVNARLLLLPKHDPQFRRNRERVNRDAERELIRVDWDLGDEDPPREPRQHAARTAPAPVAAEPVVEEPVVDDVAVEEPAVDEVAPDETVVEETAAVETAADDAAADPVAADDAAAEPEAEEPAAADEAPQDTDPS